MATTQVSFWDTNLGKTVSAMGYLALSAAISYLITASTGNPVLFGPVTPLVNVVLVFLKKTFLEPGTPNFPAN
jgi:hypothetical protein